MKIQITAIGTMRAGPEAELTKDYLDRFQRSGRAYGLGPLELREVEAKKPGKAAEAIVLTKALSGLDHVVALDERGKTLTSPEFAQTLADWRDQGIQRLGFVIGGADGLDTQILEGCAYKLSFGKMVWPHMLARVMLAEQLYRAATILAGSPYHRV